MNALTPVTFCMFDMLMDAGKDITGLPLLQRKARLAKRVGKSTMVLGHFQAGQAEQVFREAAISMGSRAWLPSAQTASTALASAQGTGSR